MNIDQLLHSFNEQYEVNKDYFGETKYQDLIDRFKSSATMLLSYSPEKMTLELLHDGSVFYTLIKNQFNIYFGYYLIDDIDDPDVAGVSIFENDHPILNFSGTFLECRKILYQTIHRNYSVNEDNIQILKKSKDVEIKEWLEKFEKGEINEHELLERIENKTRLNIRNYIKSIKIDQLLSDE